MDRGQVATGVPNVNRKQVKSKVILILAATLCALSGQASADPARSTRSLEPSATVHLADLNLASPEGARVAYARIRSAAQQVCGTSFSLWDANRWSSWRECYRTTIEATINRIDSPTLTALHRLTGKKSPITGAAT
jgi:UrcA family protein